MRCPRTDFRCCAVFSAGSNPDFDLCATVRDFHPCFPRPTDWLKCEKELFEKFEHSNSAPALRIGVLVKMHLHIRICRYVVSIQKNVLQEVPRGHCSVTSVPPLDEPTDLILLLTQRDRASMPIRLTNSTRTAWGKICPLGIAVQAVSSALFANPLVFFSSKDLARGLLHLLVQ